MRCPNKFRLKVVGVNLNNSSSALGYNEQMHEVSVMFFTLGEHD